MNSKMNQMAEEYALANMGDLNRALIPRQIINNTLGDYVRPIKDELFLLLFNAYIESWQARDKDLLNNSVEFDAKKMADYIGQEMRLDSNNPLVIVVTSFLLEQHEKFQSQIVMLRDHKKQDATEISQLKEEIERMRK